MISQGRQNMCKWLRYAPKISQKFSGEQTLVFCVMARMEIALSIFQFLFNCFATSFFKALGMYFSREVKERDATVVIAFSPVSLFAYGDDHTPVCQSFGALTEYQDIATHG